MNNKVKLLLDYMNRLNLKFKANNGLMIANCNDTRKIMKCFNGCTWILESDYDNLLRWASDYGLGIEVEYLD